LIDLDAVTLRIYKKKRNIVRSLFFYIYRKYIILTTLLLLGCLVGWTDPALAATGLENSQEEWQLNQDAYQNKAAEAIADAIMDCMPVTDK